MAPLAKKHHDLLREGRGTALQLARNRVGSILIFLVLTAVCSMAVALHSMAWVKEAIRPTERIHLKTSSGVTGTSTSSNDDLKTGKSCAWIRGRWYCQECDDHGTVTHCKTLQPTRRRHGSCRPFRRQEWDHPPRFSSHFDSTSNSEMSIRSLTRFGVGAVSKVYLEQPMCTVSTCFDLSRCNNKNSNGTIVLTVYANMTAGPHELLDYAVNHSNGKIQRVDNYQDACLVLVTKGMYSSAHELHNALHWNKDGRNNFLWDSSCFFDGKLCDAPFSTFSYGHAALASGTLSRAHLRSGYDVSLPLPRVWGRPSWASSSQQVNVHRPRKRLLSFRGSIQDSLHPYYQHRWLAAEYWEDSQDVIVDVQCKRRKLFGGEKIIYKHYQLGDASYDDMIWNSTFGFSPGGSSVGSYRFGEILSTGGIPVVTQDFVPPLHPEVDWSKCLVVVSEARIVDLPRLLREYSPGDVKDRQRACWHLLQKVIGDRQTKANGMWHGDDRVTFAKVMDIWAIRISNALHQQHEIGELNKEIMQSL